jgi:predicted dehydrogenase
MKVAVIGVGHLGKNHAKAFSKLKDVTLVGVADTNKTQAEEIATLYQTKAFTNYKDVLKEIDAVSIATPTSIHYDIAKVTLAHGIHTLIEKPITTTVAQANKLIALAEQKNARLQVGHIERFNPAFVAAKEYLQNPLFIECHRLSSFSFRSIDIDVILDLMIHDIDIILSLVNSPIKKIDAVGVKVISDRLDLANVRIIFSSGTVANLTASRASDKAMRKMRVFTDSNYVSIDFADKTASVYHRKGTLASLSELPALPLPMPAKEFMLDKFIEVKNLNITPADQLEQELSSFVDAIRENKKPLVTGADGRDALSVCHKILAKLWKHESHE